MQYSPPGKKEIVQKTAVAFGYPTSSTTPQIVIMESFNESSALDYKFEEDEQWNTMDDKKEKEWKLQFGDRSQVQDTYIRPCLTTTMKDGCLATELSFHYLISTLLE